MREFKNQVIESIKSWPFEHYVGFGVILTVLIHTIVAYYRMRRRNDKEFGKGWRKRSNYY